MMFSFGRFRAAPLFGVVRASSHDRVFGPVLLGVSCLRQRVGGLNINGEFDPGSGRTLAACLTHASRTVISELAPGDQWRTGE